MARELEKMKGPKNDTGKAGELSRLGANDSAWSVRTDEVGARGRNWNPGREEGEELVISARVIGIILFLEQKRAWRMWGGRGWTRETQPLSRQWTEVHSSGEDEQRAYASLGITRYVLHRRVLAVRKCNHCGTEARHN